MDSIRHFEVNVSGQSTSAIIPSLTQNLMSNDFSIKSVEQLSLHGMLGLHYEVSRGGSSESFESALDDFRSKAKSYGLKVTFGNLSHKKAEDSVGEASHVLTHFGGAELTYEVSKAAEEEDVTIESITNQMHHGVGSTVITLRSKNDISQLKQKLMSKGRELNYDLALQSGEAFRKNKRLAFFDMDSTLIDMEVIDELARRFGKYEQVSEITEKAMNGEFDFEESLRARVALLRGMSLDLLDEVRESMVLSEGIEELISTLKAMGYKLGIVTGGFDFFSDELNKRLGFDFAFANRLEIKDGALTGRVMGPVIDAAEKARIVKMKACDLGIPLEQTVVMGDGANDALMIAQAGLGIAYNAKKVLDEIAKAKIGKKSLTHLFHLLDITESDYEETLSCSVL
jgi:phosphoserine phosphatase